MPIGLLKDGTHTADSIQVLSFEAFVQPLQGSMEKKKTRICNLSLNGSFHNYHLLCHKQKMN